MKMPILFAALTALFWGLYGPSLGQSRGALGSPFKPYLLIGVAYLVLGIGGGLAGMMWKGDSFDFGGAGSMWGLFAGALGAAGAFTLTLAMFSGGSGFPHVVMTIVFGGAVSVSAATSVLTGGKPSPGLWLGMVVTLIGLGIVAYNTPHAPAPTRPPAVHE
jgi:hypothetical protein